MTSLGFADLLAVLGVERSYFATTRLERQSVLRSAVQDAQVPARLPRPLSRHARCARWASDYFPWYNTAHHHHGLALYTPETLFLQSRRRRRCTAAAGARRRVRPSSRAVRSRPAGSLRGRARASPSIRSFPTRLASLQPICCVLKIPPLCSRARRVAPLRRSSSFQALRRSCGRALLHRFPELAVAKSLTRSEGAVIHP